LPLSFLIHAQQNTPFPEIAVVLEAGGYGTKNAGSLKTRHQRIKASIEGVEPEDEQRVLQAKLMAEERVTRDIEEIRKKLWSYAAEAVVTLGGKQYSVSF